MFRRRSLTHSTRQLTTINQWLSGLAYRGKWLILVAMMIGLSVTQLPQMFADQVANTARIITTRTGKKYRIINLDKPATDSSTKPSKDSIIQPTTQIGMITSGPTNSGLITPYTGTGSCIWNMESMQWTGLQIYTGEYMSGGLLSGDRSLDVSAWTGSWSGFDSQRMILTSTTGIMMHDMLAHSMHYLAMRNCVWSSGVIIYPTDAEYLSGLMMFTGELQNLPILFTGVQLLVNSEQGGVNSEQGIIADQLSSPSPTQPKLPGGMGSIQASDELHGSAGGSTKRDTGIQRDTGGRRVIRSKEEFKQLVDNTTIKPLRQSVKRARDTGAINKLQLTQDIVYESTDARMQATMNADMVIFTAQGQALRSDTFVMDSVSVKKKNNDPITPSNYRQEVIEFGTPGDHLIFTKPIMITYQSDLPDGSPVSIKVQHAGQDWSVRGLSIDSNTLCDLEGNTSLPGSKTSVQGGQVRFYTCGASTFIVDDIGLSPVAIYGLRKLKSTYSGSLIRVRRSSDNTQQDIGMTVDNQLNTSALMTFVGSSSAFVTTWYDQSGNGRNLFQTVAGNQPRIVNGGVLDIIDNGKPGIRWFDTNGARLLQTAVAPFGSANEMTVVLVHKEIARQVNVAWSLANDGQGMGRIFSHIPWTNGRIYFDVGGCCNSPQRLEGVYPFAIGTTNTLTYTNSVSNNTKSIYGNGTLLLSGPAAPGSIVQMRVGSNGGSVINGMISEFMIFDSAIATGQIQIIQQSQATYYNISGSSYIPESPTNLTGVGGDTTVTLSWIAPVYTGGAAVTDYKIEYKLSSSTGWITFADGVSTNTGTIVTGLTNYLNYDFRVSAINANGTGTPSSSITLTPIGTICIESPNVLSMSGTQGTSGGVWEAQFDYFQVQDSKGINSGYYTTVTLSTLTASGGATLPNTAIERKGDPIAVLSGTTNPRVVVATGMQAYQVANTVATFIKRDTAANSNVKGEYGSRLWLRVSIPRYQSIGLYTGTITYTLYEN